MWYLIVAMILSVVGIVAVLIRHHPKSSMDASIREFERGLGALAPRSDRRGARAPLDD